MIKLKRILSFLIIVVVVFTFGINCERISDSIIEYINKKPELVILDDNGFKKDFDFKYIKNSDDYIPYNQKDLLEIFYTILNMGWDEFTFYCPAEYLECIDDIRSLSGDRELLDDLNNYVSSFNSYDTFRTLFDVNSGEVIIKVQYNYTKEEIKDISSKIDEYIMNNINDTMSDEEKIRDFHDWIINRTKYDEVMAETEQSTYDSERIYGVLNDGYAICTGYASIMEVFLSKLDIPNYKISSENHVWNAVYINDAWKHLDVTWDDPTTNTGEDMLTYDYFLVDNDVIVKDDDLNMREHSFDKNKFLEFNY